MRKHFKSCKILAELMKTYPHKVPKEISELVQKPDLKRKLDKITENDDDDDDDNNNDDKNEPVRKTPKKLRKIMKAEHLKFYPCSYCAKPCPNIQALERHLTLAHGLSLFLEEQETEGVGC